MSAPPVAPRRLEGANQAGAWPAAERVSRDAPTPTPARVRPTLAFQRGREAAALLLFTGAVFTILALLSFQGHPVDLSIHGPDWVGPVGETCARTIVSTVGVTAWYVPLELLLLVWPLLKNKASVATIARIAGDTLVVLVAASLVHVASPHSTAFGAMPMAGSLGELFGEIMRSLFSTAGSFLIGLSAIGLILIGRASFSFISWAQKATRGTEVAASKAASGARAVAEAWEKASDLRRKREEARPAVAPAAVSGSHDETTPDVDLVSQLGSVEITPLTSAVAIPAPAVAATSVAVGSRSDFDASRVDPTPSSPIVAQRSRRSARAAAEPAVSSLVASRSIERPSADKSAPERADAARAKSPAVAVSQLVVDGVVAPEVAPAVSPGPAQPARRARKKKSSAQDDGTEPSDGDDPAFAELADRRDVLAFDEPRWAAEPSVNDSSFEDAKVSPPAPAAITIHAPVEAPKPVRVDAEPAVFDREQGLDRAPIDRAAIERPLVERTAVERPRVERASVDRSQVERAVVVAPVVAPEIVPAPSFEPAPIDVVDRLGDPRAPFDSYDEPAVSPSSLASSTPSPSPVEEIVPPPRPVAAPVVKVAKVSAPAPVVTAPAVVEAPAPVARPIAVHPAVPAAQPAPKPVREKVVPAVGAGFRLPLTEMLDPAGPSVPRESKEDLLARARDLERVLANYGVKGSVVDIHTGPTVSTFEVVPAEGTKVSKVAGLSDDLALGLSCKVRIIAPIPGKNRIGFELPNRERIPVNLRELIEDERFQSMNVPLPVVLGRDIVGAPFFADLSSMPHAIVAGATGAGKSVGLNVMLTSLLYRRTPEDLKMLMIDPKVVELAPFDKIPHMLLPVVTDMKQASNALKWAVDEMERRYQLFANAGTKNISTYNGWVERARRGEIKGFSIPKSSFATAPDGSIVEVGPEREATPLPDKLPYIVIVVDEFADLMMQQGKDVEVSVARLAQKARAAGMHVILATQRPSVDVITGMIKANFPTRVGFKVAQRIDSRTILDEMGADQLLGRGDMLVKLNGVNETRRVQCPFVSEDEVHRVMDFLRLQGEPVYDESILKSRDDEDSGSSDDDSELDGKYDEAIRLVAETRRCSASWLQRKLGVGYNRAAKIVEAMEKRGVVGGANGSKEREVLIAPL